MTLIVNLFAGPGAGKSTMMAEVYAGLKRRGVDAEMAPEFARELVRSGRLKELGLQPFVFGEQLRRLQRLVDDGVEVVVTDSPLLLSLVYGPASDLSTMVWRSHNSYDNLNVFVVRGDKPYRQAGRTQTYPQALVLDRQIEEIATLARSKVLRVPSGPAGSERVIQAALARLKELQN